VDVSTLRDRLRQVVNPAGSPLPSSASPAGAGMVPPDARDLEALLGGVWRDSSPGRSFVVRRRYAPESPYGRYRVGEFANVLQAGARAASLLGGREAAGPFVFFDLETTGLSGGAGTCAFIVGCGWCDDDGAFVTEQHLLVDSATERAMLERVAQDLARSGALVTFNGKSFDAPVVETRYLFHRLLSPCAGRPHVDLLHPSRRFWGGTSESGCSLVSLEREVLGVRRVGDVPGFEIPARYFQFVRSGDGRPLVDVLEHNRLDLLSLAGLTMYLFGLVDTGPDAARHGQEALALGKVYERAGLTDLAEQAYERAIGLATPGFASVLPQSVRDRVRVDALRALALGARRQRRHDAAARWWRQLLDLPGCPREVTREAMQALAIHHEHRVRDLAAAKIFALRSLGEESDAAWGDAVRHRLARIERKISERRRSLFPSSPSQPSCGSLMSARRTSS
jgi:uncharacterized protein YprB with RNaseH-like and TPR domain